MFNAWSCTWTANEALIWWPLSNLNLKWLPEFCQSCLCSYEHRLFWDRWKPSEPSGCKEMVAKLDSPYAGQAESRVRWDSANIMATTLCTDTPCLWKRPLAHKQTNPVASSFGCDRCLLNEENLWFMFLESPPMRQNTKQVEKVLTYSAESGTWQRQEVLWPHILKQQKWTPQDNKTTYVKIPSEILAVQAFSQLNPVRNVDSVLQRCCF